MRKCSLSNQNPEGRQNIGSVSVIGTYLKELHMYRFIRILVKCPIGASLMYYPSLGVSGMSGSQVSMVHGIV